MHVGLIGVARGWVDEATYKSVEDATGAVLLRRATSNAYYALFHALAAEAANLLAGKGSLHWPRVVPSLGPPQVQVGMRKGGPRHQRA